MLLQLRCSRCVSASNALRIRIPACASAPNQGVMSSRAPRPERVWRFRESRFCNDSKESAFIQPVPERGRLERVDPKGSVRRVVRKDDVERATSGGLRRRYGSHLKSERRKPSGLQRFLHRFARPKRLVSAVRSVIDESRSSGGCVRVARLVAYFAQHSTPVRETWLASVRRECEGSGKEGVRISRRAGQPAGHASLVRGRPGNRCVRAGVARETGSGSGN